MPKPAPRSFRGTEMGPWAVVCYFYKLCAAGPLAALLWNRDAPVAVSVHGDQDPHTQRHSILH